MCEIQTPFRHFGGTEKSLASVENRVIISRLSRKQIKVRNTAFISENTLQEIADKHGENINIITAPHFVTFRIS